MDPATIAGALGALKGLGGGGGTRVSTSVATQLSIANNPVIANYIGSDGSISANPWGSATGTAPSNATSAGNDGQPQSSFLPGGYGGYYGSAPYGDQTLIPNSGSALAAQGGDGGMMAVLAAGAVGLLLLFND